MQTLTALGLKEEIHYTAEERSIKKDKAGGGYSNIGTIEDILASLLKKKVGNDGTYYQNNLSEHINYVRRVAHEKAARLYNRVLFSNTPQTGLDILREEVENRLLDLAPEATEKLMIAFRAVASDHLRFELGVVHPSHLVGIKGIGPKTRSIAEKLFSFEPVK